MDAALNKAADSSGDNSGRGGGWCPPCSVSTLCTPSRYLSLIFLIIVWSCYLIGIATPWAYVSFKNAPQTLGITPEGIAAIKAGELPLSVVNGTCSAHKFDVSIFDGLCPSLGDCTQWSSSVWSQADSSNNADLAYFYHTTTTHFEKDEKDWATVAALVTLSFVIMCFVLVAYFLVSFVGFQTYRLRCILLSMACGLVAAIFSFAALYISSTTSALNPSITINGEAYITSWIVFAELNHNCQGATYIAGPGIAFQSIGGILSVGLAVILLFEWRKKPDDSSGLTTAINADAARISAADVHGESPNSAFNARDSYQPPTAPPLPRNSTDKQQQQGGFVI